MAGMRIVVFDPTLKELQPLAKELRRASDATVDLIATPALLEGEVTEGRADFVLLEARTGGPVLQKLRRRDGQLPIVMTAAEGDVGAAQAAAIVAVAASMLTAMSRSCGAPVLPIRAARSGSHRPWDRCTRARGGFWSTPASAASSCAATL